MSVRALLAVATVAAGLALPASPATACDPYRFPYCMTYCRALLQPYESLRDVVYPPLPSVPRTGLAGCP